MNIKTVKQLSLVGVYETEAKIPVVKVPQQTVSLLLYNSQSLNHERRAAPVTTEANSII
jgi:hypothetical protein